ncbi:hypothetical protein H5410_009592 [Solanum commersonii]|uniref:Protein kinase domain-containing protein n=1 Tax=Solanum commersonii TaxID=4109 RepID=A0A9J6AIB7_SOLCO|nr:hypothetical protein H5410_009592 [Solanum commersonii]
MGVYTRDRTKHLNVITSICIFNLISTCCLTFSLPSAAECILQLGKFSVPYNVRDGNWGSFLNDNVRDEGGNWGTFLNDEACEGPFRDYLYAMGIRANKTGQMYLNSTQQMNCLTKMNDEGHELMFSVVLGDKLRKLSYNCQFQDTADKRGHLCESCVNSWKDIKEMKSKNDKYTEAGSDICRFAVLVSLTSTRITDQAWLRKLYNCLSNQKQPVNFAHTEEKEQEEEEHSELTGKHKFRPAIDLPKDSSLEVSIEEVYSATNNLNESNFIGEGTAGRVYRGVIPNNQEVAIKHITHEECIETFLREVKSLTNVRHPNLVALLGYSKNAKEWLLKELFHFLAPSLYCVMVNGEITFVETANNRVLSWTQRLEIAIDIAKGLVFLHTYHDRSIIHRDIKPTNILLGQNFEAKLSDFGLSRVIDIDESYMISEVRGTYGYVDPEYETNHHVNSAGDVYSFGIAKSLLRERRAVDFVDPKLHGDYSTDAFQLTLELAIYYSTDAFQLTLELAISCIAPKQQRPSIENVIDKLEEALAITRREKASTPHSTPVWSSTSFQEQYRTIVENVT